jgi:hypothetical protein
VFRSMFSELEREERACRGLAGKRNEPFSVQLSLDMSNRDCLTLPSSILDDALHRSRPFGVCTRQARTNQLLSDF